MNPYRRNHQGQKAMALGNDLTGMMWRASLAVSIVLTATSTGGSAAAPDHPIITEVYTDPPGSSDAPVGRDPANQHQEFIEIYLPTASDLTSALNKDALNLAFYEVEGDTSSSGYTLVNYRIDLPTFDLDSSNGLTSGAIGRPPSGVVVIGWVDYVGDPPTDLAGTPSTRVALVNGGVTSTTDFLFVAINGAQFSGTTNFPVPAAISLINMPNEASSGIIQNGSGAYLLVNRDDPGYVELYDDADDAHVPPIENADPALADGTVLQLSCLLDAFAGNNDDDFDVNLQPYDADDPIDLAAVLPLGGAFTPFVPQIALDSGNGFLRLLADQEKTTEDGVGGNEDPLADALSAYRTLSNLGPWFATPGRATFTTSPPELAVADASVHHFQALGGTSVHLPVTAANIGGSFPIEVSAAHGTSSDPTVATFAAGQPDIVSTAHTPVSPTVRADVSIAADDGAVVTTPLTVEAVNVNAGDPAVVNPTWSTTATVTVLNPLTGLDANGQPFQATVYAAVQGIVADPSVTNEFRQTEAGAFLAAQTNISLFETFGFSDLLLDPAFDLSDPSVVLPLVEEFPEESEKCTNWLNPPGPTGRLDFADTVLSSAEVVSGAGAYDGSIDACPTTGETVIRAIELNVPDTFTFGGPFSPDHPLHFVDPRGGVGDPASALTNATTARSFEIAIVDTTVNFDGSFETGATDDFGLIIEVEAVEAGAPVVDGEFVFLSFTGGLQGADVDTLQVPPGNLVATVTYLDLENLHDVLGIRSIEAVYAVDGSGNGEMDVIEAYSLNPVTAPPCSTDSDCDDGLFCNGTETCVSEFCQAGTFPCSEKFCDEETDACFAGGCDAPTVLASGPRYLRVTPAPAANSVAILVQGDALDPAIECVSLYVQEPERLCVGGSNHRQICTTEADCTGGGTCQASALLGAEFVRLTPDEWQTVHVRGPEIRPSSVYHVQAECGDAPGIVLSPVATAVTWLWGDTDHDATCNGGLNADQLCERQTDCPDAQCRGVDVIDITRNVDAFRGKYSPALTLEANDLMGCLPNRDISVIDVTAAIDAFRGFAFPCDPPCLP